MVQEAQAMPCSEPGKKLKMNRMLLHDLPGAVPRVEIKRVTDKREQEYGVEQGRDPEEPSNIEIPYRAGLVNVRLHRVAQRKGADDKK